MTNEDQEADARVEAMGDGSHSPTAMETPANARPDFWTSDEWATPPEIVSELQREFGVFELDACAREETAKAANYFTKADDALQQPWFGRVWLNPPYSAPGPWLAKALLEVNEGRAEMVVALLPASTDTGWFHDYVIGKAEVRFRRGRIRFLGWMGTPIGSPKAGTVLAIYRPRSERVNGSWSRA